MFGAVLIHNIVTVFDFDQVMTLDVIWKTFSEHLFLFKMSMICVQINIVCCWVGSILVSHIYSIVFWTFLLTLIYSTGILSWSAQYTAEAVHSGDFSHIACWRQQKHNHSECHCGQRLLYVLPISTPEKKAQCLKVLSFSGTSVLGMDGKDNRGATRKRTDDTLDSKEEWRCCRRMQRFKVRETPLSSTTVPHVLHIWTLDSCWLQTRLFKMTD